MPGKEGVPLGAFRPVGGYLRVMGDSCQAWRRSGTFLSWCSQILLAQGKGRGACWGSDSEVSREWLLVL